MAPLDLLAKFLLTQLVLGMFLEPLLRLIVLHAGTPVVVSQAILSLMFVVLGVLMIGISMVFVAKTKEKILQHRWILSAAIALTLSAVFLVMIPAAFSFYIDPDLEFFSSLSFTTLIHGIIGVPALTTALIYAFGDLPQSTRKWMRISALLWITDLGLGVVLFVQMMGLM